MKKSNLYLLAILIVQALLVQSCGLGEKKIRRRYVLENGTNREITVQMYWSGRFVTATSRTGSGQIIEGTVSDTKRYMLTALEAFDTDSAVVTIGDRRQVYTYVAQTSPPRILPTMRNILVDSAYTVVNDNLYRFTFTEQDYRNAR